MSKRSTIYFDESTHRALRLKAAATDQSISDLVNDAVRRSLIEDADDLATVREGATEPSVRFEIVLDSPEFRERLRRFAAARGVSVATVVRKAIDDKLAEARPIPRSLGIGASGERDLARRSAQERPEPRPWR